jgi:hypothetical protein
MASIRTILPFNVPLRLCGQISPGTEDHRSLFRRGAHLAGNDEAKGGAHRLPVITNFSSFFARAKLV